MSRTIKIILLLAAIATISFVFVWSKYSVAEPIINDIPNELTIEPIVAEPESVKPKTESEITTLDLPDYSSLEKDRLYTDEEGRYENLNDNGKELLKYVICNGNIRCENSVYGENWPMVKTRIISLHKDVVNLLIPTGKGNSYYLLFDLKTNKVTYRSDSYMGTEIKNDDFIILVKNEENKQSLLYFKLGMSSFSKIPLSEIGPEMSYYYRGGMGSALSEFDINNNILSISLFKNNQVWEEGLPPQKIDERVFDLNQLP